MTEFFCAVNHTWTEDGMKPIEWLISENLRSFQSRIDQNPPVDYDQYDQALLKQLRAMPKWQWSLALDQYFLQDDHIFDFWTKNKIRNHGLRHAQHVLHFCAIMGNMAKLDEKDSLILLLAACFHDIGRCDNSIEPAHGERSVARLYEHYHLPLDAPMDSFTGAFVLQSMVLVNAKSNYPMPELRSNDVHVLLDLIQYHSLSDEQAETDFKKKYNDIAVARRLKLLTVFKDCDALDRLRFEGNLDIHFLRTKIARCSLRISAGINGLV